MKVKSEKDFWSGLMFLVTGLAFAWGATEYSFGSSARPGPGYFPFGLAVILGVLGGVILFKSLTIEKEGGDPIGGIAWKPLIIIVGSMVMTGFLLPRLGLFITLPLLVIVAAMAGEEFRWGEALLNAAVLTVFSWVAFIWGLNLIIPLWPSFV